MKATCVACGAASVGTLWDYPACGPCTAAWEQLPQPHEEPGTPPRLDEPEAFEAYLQRSNALWKSMTRSFLMSRRQSSSFSRVITVPNPMPSVPEPTR